MLLDVSDQKAQNYIKRVKCSNPFLKNGKLLEALLVPDKSEQNRAVAVHRNQSENNFNTKTRAPIIFKHPVTPELVNEIYKIYCL